MRLLPHALAFPSARRRVRDSDVLLKKLFGDYSGPDFAEKGKRKPTTDAGPRARAHESSEARQHDEVVTVSERVEILDVSGGSAVWGHAGQDHRAQVPGIYSAVIDHGREVILMLSRHPDGGEILIGLSLDGTERFRRDPPEGFRFSYLTEHVSGNAALVCGAAKLLPGWNDCFFLIDHDSGSLTKDGPSY